MSMLVATQAQSASFAYLEIKTYFLQCVHIVLVSVDINVCIVPSAELIPYGLVCRLGVLTTEASVSNL